MGTFSIFPCLLTLCFVHNSFTIDATAVQKDMALSEGLIYIPLDKQNDGYVYQGFGEDFVYHTGVYYNINGEIVVDFPEYKGTRTYDCDPFYNGYAAMVIVGADGLSYFTVIDKTGKQMFEPVAGFNSLYTSFDGKYVTAAKNGEISIFDITGKLLTSIQYTGINPKESVYNVSCGVLRIGSFYINVETGTVIGMFLADENFSVTVH